MTDLKLKGRIIRPDNPTFEKSIMATMFNQRAILQKPDLMVQPKDVEDVIAIVNYARTEGKKISICSGGHSWSANHVREGSVIIDLTHFDTYQINKEAMTAKVGPALGSNVLLQKLLKQNLFFPAGHCEGVGLGGYLLQGGFGWNSRKIGMACESVLGIDVVTASGEYLHASATENADIYWSARGSGGGFFGVIVAFHLKLHPKPKYIGAIGQVYGIRYLEDLYRWVHEVGPSAPDTMELQLIMSQTSMMVFGKGIEVATPIFADTKDELNEAKEFMGKIPVRSKAKLKLPFLPFPLKMMYKVAMSHYPHNHCWGVDNMWTSASIDELMPFIKGISETLMPQPTHLLWLNWYPPANRPDMAFSMENNIYLSLYSGWKSANYKPEYERWATDWMEKMAHLSNGIQLADENLNHRTARFVVDAHLQKLDEIRAKRDPQQVFNAWHSRPEIGNK